MSMQKGGSANKPRMYLRKDLAEQRAPFHRLAGELVAPVCARADCCARCRCGAHGWPTGGALSGNARFMCAPFGAPICTSLLGARGQGIPALSTFAAGARFLCAPVRATRWGKAFGATPRAPARLALLDFTGLVRAPPRASWRLGELAASSLVARITLLGFAGHRGTPRSATRLCCCCRCAAGLNAILAAVYAARLV